MTFPQTRFERLHVSNRGVEVIKIDTDIDDHPGPVLLGSDRIDEVAQEDEKSREWRSLPKHKDEDQVRLDVDRSFIYYPRSTVVLQGCRSYLKSIANASIT